MGGRGTLSVLLALLFCAVHAARVEVRQTFITLTSGSARPATFATEEEWYASALASVRGVQLGATSEQHHAPLYTYKSAYHGFAAKLTAEEAAAMEEHPGVLATFPDSIIQLQTTHTPEFLGLTRVEGVWPASGYGNDVIVGILDSGIWPESPSFNDRGLGPVPARWRGLCEEGTAFKASSCNKKLIGARAFYKGYEAATGPINETEDYRSPRDHDGHGTHTSSTAAGSYAYRASLFGFAEGTARGMAPNARIAAYKVCWVAGCVTSDILAAMDMAVADGVNILSLSLGGGLRSYFGDPISIGAYGAMEKGVLISCAAGNSGPFPQSVLNVAPWILTVAASSTDREFSAPVKLGSGATFRGSSLYSGKGLGNALFPLIYGSDASFNATFGAALCLPGSLNPKRVRGKIVVCDRGVNERVAKGMVVREAGGVGMILADTLETGNDLSADSHVLPASLVGFNDGELLKGYIARDPKARAGILFKGTVLGTKPAPVMASFSSRGPNSITPEILKPDLTAPGVNILAAWTGDSGPTGLSNDDRKVGYNILSGTSMACPHVTGLAALLKAAHPDWSPAAIKSALMTSATTVDNTGKEIVDDFDFNPATPFTYGAGHVNPAGAVHPGLVYDLGVQDYVDFLCSLNYTERMLAIFTKGRYKCSRKDLRPGDLNYPSFSAVFSQGSGGGGGASSYSQSFGRTVTNVGAARAVYKVSVVPPKGVVVKVVPEVLSFSSKGQRLRYQVSFQARAVKLGLGEMEASFGALVWSDELHRVRSPIVFTWQQT